MIGRDKTKKDGYMLKTLLNMFKRKQLRKDHPLQRNTGQWKEEDAESGLVASIIKGEDVDPIKICEQITSDTEFDLWLIDGLQRLTTLEKYRNNVFEISDKIEMPFVFYKVENCNGKMTTIKYDLRNKYFRDLPDELKDEFDSYSIDVVKHLDCTPEEIAYHIARYNRFTQMNYNQKNILPMYNVAEFVKKISKEHDFFYNCGNYSETDITKNTIDRIICESIMTIFHLDNWNKGGKKMGKYLNNHAKKEEFDILKNDLDRLSLIIDQDTTGKLFNIKNSFIWFTAFHIFTSYNIKDEKFIDFLIEFQRTLHSKTFKEYDNQSFDTYDKSRSTKDKKVVIAKIDILTKLMEEYFHITKEAEQLEWKISSDNVIGTDIDMTENTEDNSNSSELEPIVNFVKETLNDNEINAEDIIEYEDFLEDVLKINTSLYQQCKIALIALTGYAYKIEEDVLFSEWLTKYSQNNMSFGTNQKSNYAYLKHMFDIYCRRNGEQKNDTA